MKRVTKKFRFSLGDIRDVTREQLEKIRDDHPRLTLGIRGAGFPWQGLSRLNRHQRKGLADARSGLFYDLLDLHDLRGVHRPDHHRMECQDLHRQALGWTSTLD